MNLAQSSNELGFDLYRRLCRNSGNLVISPASLSIALTMTWGGARGETAAQMRQVLHLEGSDDEVMAASGRLLRSLQDPSRPFVLRIANRLFGEATYGLVPAFVELTRETFDAPIELLDFKGEPEASRLHINQWVEDRTERRIQDLVPSGAIDPLTRLVLVNTIYFLGDWRKPFQSAETYPAFFHLGASSSKLVPTMHQTAPFSIAQKDGVTALELPYQGGRLSMLLLVPDEIDGLPALEGALDTQRLDMLTNAMRMDFVGLALPKFDVNPAMSLGRNLAAMGMPLAFDDERADFTGIANPPSPDDRLYIADVFHKGFVRVDEKGTEAAAATPAVMLTRGLPEPPQRSLDVDRPFLFLLRDNTSGLVLFLGRVSDPSRS